MLDDPLIMYYDHPEKSADMSPDTSADALGGVCKVIFVSNPTSDQVVLRLC